ncbi:50S ribosomal protein L6 [Formosimonas limnophila]|uniref:Large ribosomal subunit protein uL6 n=1 Tax=Formosimonas limnophila TaxID=1384487 RepID=A0A8J3CNP5_9BURK|nr:50S ribosomal protein L6 [Formosimonas limnophila]GHA76985.1 50S ribosomal protein L6 [Formosimonas limnophila]
MSRVGKNPVAINGADIAIAGNKVTVKGKLGTLESVFSDKLAIENKDGQLTITRKDESREANALSGTTRALLANMVKGVTEGFQKKLTLVGVGYRAKAEGTGLKLELGFSHDVVHQMPEGVTAETPSQTEIIIKGVDKQQVGQVAAEVRAYRPPEPYKGKGVRYADEVVIIKETKKK